MRRDTKRKKTNPVWYINTMFKELVAREGTGRPNELFEACGNLVSEMLNDSITLPEPAPIHKGIPMPANSPGKEVAGSVGLVVDQVSGEGFVTELLVKSSTAWDVSPNLPFREPHVIDALMKLLSHCNAGSILPELRSFKIRDTLDSRMVGGSMDIAGLMAIVRHVNIESFDGTLLDFVASLVQPGLGDELVPVGRMEAKIDAFSREYGQGSLLIHHPRTDLDAIGVDGKFEHYWAVESYSELAESLRQNGLVDALIQKQALSPGSVDAVWRQVRFYESEGEHRLEEAEKLARNAIACIDDDTPFRVRVALTKIEEDLQRHRGDFENAIANAERYLLDERFNETASYEDLVSRDYRLAASYYDAHRFDEIRELLSEHLKRFRDDSRIVSVETGPKLLNTQARVLSATGDAGWEDLFRESLEIQSGIQSPDEDRTRNYLIKAYLQVGDLDSAKREMEIAESRRNKMTVDSEDHLDFYHAEYARQQGIISEKPNWFKDEKPQSAHARAFFIQAYARQPHPPARTAELLRIAAKSLTGNGRRETNIRIFLALSCDVGTAIYCKSEKRIQLALDELRRYLNQESSCQIKNWYQGQLNVLNSSPNLKSLNALLTRVPHF